MITGAGPPAHLLDELREKVVPILRPYASRIELFGSFARGEQRPDSDVDLLVTLRTAGERPPLDLLDWVALEELAAKCLRRRVEMVTEAELSPYVRPYIEPERIIVYEE